MSCMEKFTIGHTDNNCQIVYNTSRLTIVDFVFGEHMRVIIGEKPFFQFKMAVQGVASLENVTNFALSSFIENKI